MNSLEIKDKKDILKRKMNEIVETCKQEVRTMTDEEKTEFEGLKSEVTELNNQLEEIKKELENYKVEEEPEVQPETQENNKRNINTKMKNQFKLIKAIRSITNNQPLDEFAKGIVNAGIQEMRKSGQNFAGQIVLPCSEDIELETREITAVNGSANIATDTLAIVAALRNNLTLSQAGAVFMSGLVGNVSIPTYSGSNVAWAGETAGASNGEGTIGEIELTPKRLTAYLDISKQFLNQDSNSAEELLMNDLIAAVSEKLEASILSSFSGSTTQPQGLFSVVNPVTGVTTYAKVVALEENLEGKNYGEKTWIVSPKAKSVYKTTQKATNGSMVMEGAEMDGYKVLTSNGLPANALVFGDFNDLIIAQWGALDITVDPYSQAANGKIRLVINAYFDVKPRRASSFVTAFSA